MTVPPTATARLMTADRRLQVFDILTPQRVDAPTGQHRDSESSLFRQPEVCEIARIQAYVLRSWEAEFPDLGVAKTEGGPRVYRRADVERVLRLKHLLFVEGLTLAGARRKIAEEQPVAAGKGGSRGSASCSASDARERILSVGRTLRELAGDAVAAARVRRAGRASRFQLRSVDARDRRRAGTAKPPRRRLRALTAVTPSRRRRREASLGRFRDVAQPGSAPDWGSGGRRFESCHPDQFSPPL